QASGTPRGSSPTTRLTSMITIGSQPILRPTGFVPIISPDRRTFSLRATIANTGVADGSGPLDVYFQILEAAGGHTAGGSAGSGTIQVPSSVVIQGTASSAGKGGAIITDAADSGTPYNESSEYNVLIILDPKGTYEGGVVQHGDFI